MFSIEEIIQECITGQLNFDRAFIRLRRGHRFPIKNWKDVPSLPAKCAKKNRILGWKSALQTLVHQFQIVDVYRQDVNHIPLPEQLRICTDIEDARADRPLLIIAKNLPIPVPHSEVSTVVVLLEEPKTIPHFETILIAKELEGISTPIFQSYLQDFYLLHPWQKASSQQGIIEIWDLINGVDSLRIQTLWMGEASASSWLRLVGHIGDPTHTPPRDPQSFHPIDVQFTPAPVPADPHTHHHEHTHTQPSLVLQRVQFLCDALRYIPPEKYNHTLHPTMLSQTLSPLLQQVFELLHPTAEEEPSFQGSILIIAPEEPFTYLFGLVFLHLLQGWHVALYPAGSNAEACAFLAQIAHKYRLPISLQTRFPNVSRILACDPLPKDLQWMYGDSRLEIMGRRFSMVWFSQTEFRSLAWSVRVHEGKGAFAPAGILCAPKIDWDQLRTELRAMSILLPYTEPDIRTQYLMQERISLAKQYGQYFAEENIAVLPIEQFQPYPCPQIITFYPVHHAQEAFEALLPYQGWLNFLGSDDIQYPHPELEPDRNLLSLQQLFRAVLPLARLQDPPLELWLEKITHNIGEKTKEPII